MKLCINQLNGAIPLSIGNLTNLRFLFLYHNELSGIIPQEIENLKKLNSLLLTKNNFRGQVLKSFRNLTDLVKLRLNQNYLTGNIPKLLILIQTSLSLISAITIFLVKSYQTGEDAHN